MGINKVLKLTKVLLLVLAFTFSGNIGAITARSKSTAVVLSGKKKRKNKQKPPRNRKCPRCKRSKCKGHNGGGDKIQLNGGLGILVIGTAAFGIKK